MAERTLAEIPLSLVEYRATFQEPIFVAFERPTLIADALYRSFREWNITFENISWKALPINANDVQIVCDLFNKRMTFTVMLGVVSLLVTNPNWSEVGLVGAVVRAGMGAVQASTSGVTKEQGVTLAMHLRPQGKSIQDVTTRFRAISSGPGIDAGLRGYGFSVYGHDISWLVDLSAIYPEALFVRTSRVFGPSVSFEDIAVSLKKDEDEILEILQLRVD